MKKFFVHLVEILFGEKDNYEQNNIRTIKLMDYAFIPMPQTDAEINDLLKKLNTAQSK